MRNNNLRFYQQGMTTLTISTIILFSVTVVSLYTAKSIIMDQKISANAFRAKQAFLASDGGMSFVTSYFDKNTAEPDATAKTILASDINGSPTITSFTNSGSNVNVVVSGQSDDGLSTRSITQQLGRSPISGSGVNQPLITKGGVGLTGNMAIYNKYSNINVWAGTTVNIGNSNSSESYVLTPGTDISASCGCDYASANKATRRAAFTDTSSDVTKASGRGGNHIDIIEQDVTLSSLTDDQFFENFMNETKTIVKKMAVDNGQYTTTVGDVSGKKGLVWLGDGSSDITMNGGTIGTIDEPVVLIVNANNHTFTTRGGPTIYGILYVIGDWDTAGNLDVYGSVVVEGSVLNGTGNTKIVYDSDALNPDSPLAGTTSRVAGTWRDF